MPEKPIDQDLIEAVKTYDFKETKRLLAAGVNPNARDYAFPALHIACWRGYHDFVKLLLEYGADIEATDIFGGAPLHEACRGHSPDVVLLLLTAGADPNAKDKNGATALHCAAVSASAAIIRALLEHGADAEKMDDQEKTALDVVLHGNRPERDVILDLFQELTPDVYFSKFCTTPTLGGM